MEQIRCFPTSQSSLVLLDATINPGSDYESAPHLSPFPSAGWP